MEINTPETLTADPRKSLLLICDLQASQNSPLNDSTYKLMSHVIPEEKFNDLYSHLQELKSQP